MTLLRRTVCCTRQLSAMVSDTSVSSSLHWEYRQSEGSTSNGANQHIPNASLKAAQTAAGLVGPASKAVGHIAAGSR